MQRKRTLDGCLCLRRAPVHANSVVCPKAETQAPALDRSDNTNSHKRPYSSRWHENRRPLPASRNVGSSVLQRLNTNGQRVWKWQPDGGAIGEGMSPSSTMRSFLARGLGIGAAASSARV